jgi:very-short-patch-repair endonuclease/DNA polymerase III delta prime subunit
MSTISDIIDQNRKELLDLSTRNRLLSIPKASKSARLVHIYEARSDQICRLLVDEKKSLGFIPGKKAESRPPEPPTLFEDEVGLPQPDEEDEAADGTPAKRYVDSKLQTALSSEGLQRRLLALFTEARTLLEEQGVNVLYLALGQLKWFEHDDAETARYAPLVLIPVKLERRTAMDRFHLRWLEEDLQENLSLRAKLENDFGVELPEFGDTDELNVADYFRAVSSKVSKLKGFDVLPDEITLGFFSFSKFLMFRDLDASVWPEKCKLDKHPLIQGLMLDGFPHDPEPFGDDANLDELVPVNQLDHVVNADGSQTLVIEHARRGRNLVVQGPPGTGKSQTITNLIATAVLDGRKVLFVAEKMAALEVVKRRLEAAGLGALCLELHSNKANKRAVLEEIGRTWALGRPLCGNEDSILQQLDQLRSALNQHCAALHTCLHPAEVTPFDVLGVLVRFRTHGVRHSDYTFPSPQDWPKTRVEEIRRILSETVERVGMMGNPADHPWRGVRRGVFLRIDEEPLSRLIMGANGAVQRLRPLAEQAAQFLQQKTPDNLREIELVRTMAEQIAKAPPLDRAAIGDGVWNAGVDGLRNLVAAGRRLNSARNECAGKVIDETWSKDHGHARGVIAAHGTSLFRWLVADYRKAIADFESISSDRLPSTLKARLALFDSILVGQKAYKEIEANDSLGAKAFGTLWRKDRTDWAQAEAIVGWVDGHIEADLGESFRRLFAQIADQASAGRFAEEINDAVTTTVKAVATVLRELDLDLLKAFKTDALRNLSLTLLSARFEEWLGSVERLGDWINYNSRAERLRQCGVGSLIDAVETGGLDSGQATDAFEWAYHSQLMRHIVSLYPRLGTFDGLLHNRTVEEFRRVDRERMELSKLRTLLAHYERMPREGAGVGPTGVINGELARKRGHMPIRKLLRLAGNAVQAIKPVFMMSPLSVAQYLEPGGIDFDILIIDEASQVEPVDALGAVARCRQIIVVGDSRQLPPTRFFMQMTSNAENEGENEEMAAAKDIESILGLCLARGIPPKMLRWHYRSRHHTLIAVSNHEFYENGLFIVPSPYPATGDLGLRFHHIADGVFDSGVTAVNRIEAQAVAQAVIEHARGHAGQSLGVAAFSIKQRQAIQDELELLRRSTPGAETFFDAHPTEPFFIKNLENVQGDERDVIFISVGYAKDPSGFLAMRFGPLSTEGGERRLNVLISRAKLRCEVFSSVVADDIDLARAGGRGVAALKSFLRYAQTGQLGYAAKSEREEDSPFEEAVKCALETSGLKIDTQVGEAGFFIDLAVRDEKQEGRYILGIECDGAAYHSSKSSRDRDRLRQAVLEDHGWIIHRIWSTDWFQRPERELRRVLEAVERVRRGLESSVISPAGRLQDNTTPAPGEIERVRDKDADGPANPAAYVMATLPAVPRTNDLASMHARYLAGLVSQILEVECPIHPDEVALRLRSAWGLERTGYRIQAAVEKALAVALQSGRFRREEGFIVDSSKPAKPRYRADALPPSLRKPEYIPPQEIRVTIIEVVELHLGAAADELAATVARMLGFKSTGPQIRSLVDAQVRKLIRSGILADENGFLQRTPNATGSTPLPPNRADHLGAT